MKPLDLIETARSLAHLNLGKRPRQADLRRAVSSAYYAMFHHLARTCADLMVGGAQADRSKPAWRQVYRALEHRFAKDACSKHGIVRKFPAAIEDFATAFVFFQEKRHAAGYDPYVTYTRSEVIADIDRARATIEKFTTAATRDQRAFAAYVLLKTRP